MKNMIERYIYDVVRRLPDENKEEVKNWETVDVKNTVYPNGKLLVRTGKEEKYVDIYALMIGTFPDFVFCRAFRADPCYCTGRARLATP